MKTMIIVESEYEREQLRKCWEGLMAAKTEGIEHPRECFAIESSPNMCINGAVDLFHSSGNDDGDLFAIVYDLRPDGWHIYNFNTMEEEIVTEGDLAGLCNSKAGNFPFFN